MSSSYLAAYRSILRELTKSSTRMASAIPGKRHSNVVSKNVREIFEGHRNPEELMVLRRDIDNAVVFLRSQRMHKTLLERYNPLHGLTQEERIKATARRVGLDMPVDIILKS